jgi:hypothetical protein
MAKPEATLAHNAQINNLHRLHKMVIKSIEDESGMNCIDVTSRPDGQFTFKVFRKDPEDQGRWTLVGDYSGLQFNTEEQALCQAASKIPWLAQALLLSGADQRNHLDD